MATRAEFAASIKAKYPAYKDVDDSTLVAKMLEKYPQYQDRITDDAPQAAAVGMGDLKAVESQAPAASKSSLFPSASQVQGSGILPTAARAGLGALDVMGAPTRALATARGMEMSDPNAYLLRPEVERLKMDPASQIAEQQAMAQNYQNGSGMAYPGMTATPKQAYNNALEFGGRVASDPLSYAGLLAKTLTYIPKMLGAGGRAVGKLNRGVGKLAQEMTGVPEEALRAYGNPAERARMAANAGKESEIGHELLSHIDKPDKFLPEKQAVDAALENMGDIPIQSTVDKLEASKGQAVAGRLSPEKAAANAGIDKYIDFLKGGDEARQTVSAKEFRSLRQDLDAPIKWDEEGGAIKNAALKAGRTTMKNELLKKAAESGNPGYAKAMEGWSDKLDKLGRIKKLLGKTGEARDKRVEGFVNNLFGKNSEYKQELMRDLDDIFQSDLTGRAKAAQNAQALGPGGKPTWLPRQMTGRSGLGLATSIAAGTAGNAVGIGAAGPVSLAVTALTASPKIAAGLTLPMLTKMEQTLKAANVALTPKSASLFAALKKPINEAQKVRLASLLAAELESQLPANAIPFRKVAEEKSPPQNQVSRR